MSFPRPWIAFLSVMTVLPFCAQAYEYHRGPVERHVRAPCPGLYCGRRPLNETHVTGCGQCPRGWRVANNSHSLCEKCEDTPNLNEWLFMTFHGLFVLILHWMAIDFTTKRRNFTKEVLGLHFCAFIEVALSATLTVLLHEPVGKLYLVSCPVNHLSDWYSFLHNPTPNYDEALHCTQEIVYPLYTMIFMFYGFSGLAVLLLRPFLASKLVPRRAKSSIYAALYFLPILAMIHAIGGGLVFFTYPYIVFVLSIISCAAHFALKLDQSAKSLLRGCLTDIRNLVILVGHWLLHAFGILAITKLTSPTLHLSLLLLVPLPALFYVATVKFTDPSNFCIDMTN